MLVEHIQTGKRYEAYAETRRVACYEQTMWRVNGETLSAAEFWRTYRQVPEMEPQA